MHRVDGTHFAAVGFTNLSQDHLDFHGDIESYFEAKARLFEPAFAERAVVNVDDAYGARIAADTSVPVVAVHPSELADLVLRSDGTSFSWRGRRVEIPLSGRFNAANALIAAEMAATMGVGEDAIVEGLRNATPAPGRFEVVHRDQPVVVVDYAHTPDGLQRVLETAREVGRGRVIVVFGCGGDRDRGKRPLMGAVAERLADVVVVTTDNPRHEAPEAIVDEILGGLERPDGVRVELDRRTAIADALREAREHDLVVIAGKGHETVQIVGDEERPFDDREVARAVLDEQATT
jgi:UDP-N-acetylmuramoyl-L-alanyl-D-glutamate--2,6-diaminopimelate ligase